MFRINADTKYFMKLSKWTSNKYIRRQQYLYWLTRADFLCCGCDMEGKIPTWWENSFLEMGHGRKNSHIAGKIPTWSEKKTGRGT
jgi:hypothetical protein